MNSPLVPAEAPPPRYSETDTNDVVGIVDASTNTNTTTTNAREPGTIAFAHASIISVPPMGSPHSPPIHKDYVPPSRIPSVAWTTPRGQLWCDTVTKTDGITSAWGVAPHWCCSLNHCCRRGMRYKWGVYQRKRGTVEWTTRIDCGTLPADRGEPIVDVNQTMADPFYGTCLQPTRDWESISPYASAKAMGWQSGSYIPYVGPVTLCIYVSRHDDLDIFVDGVKLSYDTHNGRVPRIAHAAHRSPKATPLAESHYQINGGWTKFRDYEYVGEHGPSPAEASPWWYDERCHQAMDRKKLVFVGGGIHSFTIRLRCQWHTGSMHLHWKRTPSHVRHADGTSHNCYDWCSCVYRRFS